MKIWSPDLQNRAPGGASYRISTAGPIGLPALPGFSTPRNRPSEEIAANSSCSLSPVRGGGGGVGALRVRWLWLPPPLPPPRKREREWLPSVSRSPRLTCRGGAPKTRPQTRRSRESFMGDVFVCDAVRTPIGRFGGSLAK